MGILTNREIVVTGIQDIGLRVHVVVGGQVFFFHGNGEVLRLPGRNHLLVKAAELHGGLFYLIVHVILGIGGLEVNLNGVFAIYLAHIGHIHIHLNGGALILDGKVGVSKVGIAQAITEGESNILVIVIITGISLIQNVVFIPGFIIAVTNIDAFFINNIVPVALLDAGVGVILGGSHIVVRSIGIGIGSEVLHGGCGVVVLQEGIYNASRRIDLTSQNICNSVDSGHTHITDPKHSIDAIVIHKIQLQGIGGVQQNHDLLKYAVLFQLLQIGQHINLVLIQPQIVAVRHVGFQFGQTTGQVSAFTAGTSKNNQRHITIVRPSLLQGIGVLCPGHFIDAVLGLIAAGGVRIHAGIAAGGVELPLIQIHGIRTKGLFQRSLQRNSVISGNLAGTGTAIEQMEGGLGEGGELCSGSQRQRVVPVYQKCRAL